MKLARLASIVVALAFARGVSIEAAPILHDLGDGLRYVRPVNFPSDLPTSSTSSTAGALVLDLRGIVAAEDSSAPLVHWLKSHARADAPIFALVNCETAPSLFRALAEVAKQPGLLTLGIGADHFAPDVLVHTDEANEDRALQEIEKGASLHQLTQENAAKDRIDEAALMRDQRGEPAEPSRDDPSAELSDEPADATQPAPLVDRTLQRAIQTHRALRALKRL